MEDPYLKLEKNTPEEDTARDRDYLGKIKRHKLQFFYRSFLGLILLGALIAIFYFNYKSRIYTTFTVKSTTPFSRSAASEIKALGDCFMLYSRDGARCVDKSGTVLWDQTYEMQSPRVHICDSVAAIGDNGGRSIYVVNSESIIGEISTNLPLVNFAVASNGVVAAILEDSDTTWIYLYSTTGTPLVYFRTSMRNSGYPLAISLSPNAELFAVSYLYVYDGGMRTSISFYNFGDVGQNETDRHVSGFDYYGNIVPYVQFLNSSSIFAVSDDRIMFYSGSQIPSSQAEVFLNDNVKSVYTLDDRAVLVLPDTTAEHAYKMDVYSSSGNVLMSVGIDIEYTAITGNADSIVVYNDTQFQVFSKSGVEKYTGSFTDQVSLLVPTARPFVYNIMTPNSLKTIALE